MSDVMTTEPIVKTITLNVSAAKAFQHFTKNIHIWWPLKTHSLSQENAQTVVFESKIGGRIYEIEKSGKEREWGRVLDFEENRRLVFSWVLEAPDKATEVEVRFDEDKSGKTTMTLIHRGWDQRPDGAEWRGNYNQGWEGVINEYQLALQHGAG